MTSSIHADHLGHCYSLTGPSSEIAAIKARVAPKAAARGIDIENGPCTDCSNLASVHHFHNLTAKKCSIGSAV